MTTGQRKTATGGEPMTANAGNSNTTIIRRDQRDVNRIDLGLCSVCGQPGAVKLSPITAVLVCREPIACMARRAARS